MADKFMENLLAEKTLVECRIAELTRQMAAGDELLRACGLGHEPKIATTSWHTTTPGTITKAEAVKVALTKAGRPVKPRELSPLMEEAGYVFTGKNKLDALSNLLYGKKQLDFVTRTKSGLALKK